MALLKPLLCLVMSSWNCGYRSRSNDGQMGNFPVPRQCSYAAGHCTSPFWPQHKKICLSCLSLLACRTLIAVFEHILLSWKYALCDLVLNFSLEFVSLATVKIRASCWCSCIRESRSLFLSVLLSPSWFFLPFPALPSPSTGHFHVKWII